VLARARHKPPQVADRFHLLQNLTEARDAPRLRQAQGLQPREQRPGHALPLVIEGQQQPLTTRRSTRLVLKRSLQRTDEDTQLIAQLQAQHYELAVVIDLAQDFCAIVRERHADRCDPWLACAIASGVAPCSALPSGCVQTITP
jgi:transposase